MLACLIISTTTSSPITVIIRVTWCPRRTALPMRTWVRATDAWERAHSKQTGQEDHFKHVNCLQANLFLILVKLYMQICIIHWVPAFILCFCVCVCYNKGLFFLEALFWLLRCLILTDIRYEKMCPSNACFTLPIMSHGRTGSWNSRRAASDARDRKNKKKINCLWVLSDSMNTLKKIQVGSLRQQWL